MRGGGRKRRKNDLLQLGMLNKIAKPSASLLQPKSCKNNAQGNPKNMIFENKWRNWYNYLIGMYSHASFLI